MATEKQKLESVAIGANRRKDGTFGPGNIANPEGRPIATPEQKLLQRTIKEFIKEHKETLAASLPLISPVLIEKALGGDIPAIKEIHDRVMGKPPQEIDANILVETAFQKYGKLENS